MKTLLAFDTSTEHCTVALTHGMRTVEHTQNGPTKHAACLLPMIQAQLDLFKAALGVTHAERCGLTPN
jgi:tRNA A37 threonylcarbamoyladenosine modification protein TsaB